MKARMMVLACAVMALFVTTVNAQSAASQPPTFKLPDPSGPFGIGRVGYEWIDTSRPDFYSSDPHAHRALMVYLWYPSARSAAGERRHTCLAPGKWTRTAMFNAR
jgi:hypothetical protein